MLDRTEFTALLQDIAAKEGIQQRLSDRFCLSVYREMDSSSSGAISWDEFKEFFRDFYTHRKHRLEQAIAGASQFTPAWPSPSASMPPATEDPLQEDELKQLWAHFDRDNSGTLSRQELYLLLDRARQYEGQTEPLSRSFVDDAFTYIDRSHAGVLRWDDFKRGFNDIWTRREYWLGMHKEFGVVDAGIANSATRPAEIPGPDLSAGASVGGAGAGPLPAPGEAPPEVVPPLTPPTFLPPAMLRKRPAIVCPHCEHQMDASTVAKQLASRGMYIDRPGTVSIFDKNFYQKTASGGRMQGVIPLSFMGARHDPCRHWR
eukprot:GHVU01177815.1.p1 GENE.GHVU01177815.1~~GHVU01177815.1.p1  ORF type:complete len:317 (-),score=32.83 GHVU01177815.1:1238-2188(-)